MGEVAALSLFRRDVANNSMYPGSPISMPNDHDDEDHARACSPQRRPHRLTSAKWSSPSPEEIREDEEDHACRSPPKRLPHRHASAKWKSSHVKINAVEAFKSAVAMRSPVSMLESPIELYEEDHAKPSSPGRVPHRSKSRSTLTGDQPERTVREDDDDHAARSSPARLPHRASFRLAQQTRTKLKAMAAFTEAGRLAATSANDASPAFATAPTTELSPAPTRVPTLSCAVLGPSASTAVPGQRETVPVVLQSAPVPAAAKGSDTAEWRVYLRRHLARMEQALSEAANSAMHTQARNPLAVLAAELTRLAEGTPEGGGMKARIVEAHDPLSDAEAARMRLLEDAMEAAVDAALGMRPEEPIRWLAAHIGMLASEVVSLSDRDCAL